MQLTFFQDILLWKLRSWLRQVRIYITFCVKTKIKIFLVDFLTVEEWNDHKKGKSLVIEKRGTKVRQTKNEWTNVIGKTGYLRGKHSWVLKFEKAESSSDIYVVCELNSSVNFNFQKCLRILILFQGIATEKHSNFDTNCSGDCCFLIFTSNTSPCWDGVTNYYGKAEKISGGLKGFDWSEGNGMKLTLDRENQTLEFKFLKDTTSFFKVKLPESTRNLKYFPFVAMRWTGTSATFCWSMSD